MESEFLKFTAKVPSYLKCKICFLVFTKPTHLNCGHTFCQKCIFLWILKEKSCPICRNLIKEKHLTNDLIAQYAINDLAVKCAAKNCDWQGIFSEFRTHREICRGTAYTEIEKEIKNLIESNKPIDEIIGEELDKGRSEEFMTKFFEMIEKKPAKRPEASESTIQKRSKKRN